MYSKKPLVSVIVTNYNGKKYLKKCFNSLLSQTYPNIELIFADDGSTDGSTEFMKKNFPQIKRAVLKKNSGVSVSANNGTKIAKGEYYLIFNNDTIAFPNFIEEMIKVAESNPKIGVACPQQLPYRAKDDKNMNYYQKDIGTGSDMYGYVSVAKEVGHIFYPDAAIFIRSDLFKKIGGFDPTFRLYGEDMDICWRVHLLGFKIKPTYKAKFRHDSFCAQKENGKFVTTYGRRYLVERQVINKLFKYYRLSTLWWLLPKFIFYYLAESLFFLIIRLDWRMFFSVYVKAIIWNLGQIKNISRNRKYIQKIRKVDDKYILSLMHKKYRKLEAVRRCGVPIIKNTNF